MKKEMKRHEKVDNIHPVFIFQPLSQLKFRAILEAMIRVTEYLLKGTSLSYHDLWPCSLFFPFILGHLSIFGLFLFLGLLFLGMVSLVVVIVRGLGLNSLCKVSLRYTRKEPSMF